MVRKVCVVTGTRAEFGLLKPLMKILDENPNFVLQTLVTGMHLSPEFGMTINEIEKESLIISKKVEMTMSSDSPVGICKSMGLGAISMSEALSELEPDLVVILGDRYEALSAAICAMVLRIPIAHLHGGESTEGLIDEPIRHSITKMSHIHFVSTDDYRRRVIQLGEQPEKVINVGALVSDSIKQVKLLSKTELEESLDFQLGDKSLLVTFHPTTLENKTGEKQVDELLRAIDEFKDAKILFTMPNADTDGRILFEKINHYANKNPSRVKAFTSLGQLRYLSALSLVDGVVGNSSSGILEAPFFKKGVVNIGDRQKGRVRGQNVIDCKPIQKDIFDSISKILSDDFKADLLTMENPYEGDHPAETIAKILMTVSLDEIVKKKFYDL